MNLTKMRLIKVFFLLAVHGCVSPTICFAALPDFLDDTEPQGMSILQRDIKIPLGFKDDTVEYVVLLTGTPLMEIAPKISQKREELGLSSHIPLDQQDAFFQDYLWQTTKYENIKAPMSGKIIQLFIHNGQHVKAGEALCIIEAMKMQHRIVSAYAGEIKNIFTEEDTVTNSGSMLISLLPPSASWEDINQAQIFQNKDFLIPLFPWATTSPTEIPPSPLNPSPGGDEVCNAADDDEHQLLATLQEEPVHAPSLDLEENSFSELIQEALVVEEKTSAPLPVLLLEPIILPVAPEQESEQLILMNYDTPPPQDKLATSPTRGEVSLVHDTVLSVPLEERYKMSMSPPLPLWERSPEGRVRGPDLSSLLIPLTLGWRDVTPEQESEASSLNPLTPQVSFHRSEKLVLESISPPSSMVDKEKAENLSVEKKSNLKSIPFAVKTGSLPEQKNLVSFKPFRQKSLRSFSKLTKLSQNCHAELVPASNQIPKQVHNYPKLRQVRKKSSLRAERSNPFLYCNWIAPPPAEVRNDDGVLFRTAVKQVRDDSSVELNTEYRKRSSKTYFHISTWGKHICGLIALSKLIFAFRAMIKYVFFLFQNVLLLNAAHFNTHKLTFNKVVSNRNHRRWIRKKAA